MRIFFQIIIVAIVLYLIYIIYDLFGEFILSTINYILVNFNHFKQYVTFKLMDLLGGPDNSDKLDIESNKLNSRIELTQSELENILVKDKLATDYNKEVEYRENQKVKAKILRK
jgi:predicted PurR-regulated permease PerM